MSATCNSSTPGSSKEEMVRLLRMMLRIRAFEEKVADLVSEKQIITPCHLYTGQEAVATGVGAALRRDDYIFSTHRSHGHYLAKGGDLKAAMAELFGRATGCSRGHGGSMHLVAPEVGMLGSSSIVGGSMAISVGAALAEKVRGSGRVSVVFHGDGVPEEGTWHESANFAAVHRLPMVFICENNLYCTHMSLQKRRVYDNIPQMAAGHGFKTVIADGNNVLEVLAAARTAVEEARKFEGPWLVEYRTYRWRGHVGPNYDVDLGLRSQEEIDSWKERCPVKQHARYLMDNAILTETEIAELEKAALAEVDDAVSFAKASPHPEPGELLQHVFRKGVDHADNNVR